MKNFDFKRYLRKCVCLLFLSVFFNAVHAQQLHVGAGVTFYVPEGVNFTTGGTIITKAASAAFVVEAGASWATNEFVNNNVVVLGAGTTTVNIGHGSVGHSPMTITTNAGDQIYCRYQNIPPSGNLDASISDYVLSDTEFWTVASNIIYDIGVPNTSASTDVMVSGLTASSGATYGGEAGNNPILVRYNGTSWVPYASSPGFGNFAFASQPTDIKLNIKMFLQGALTAPVVGEESFMRDDLRNASLIPTTSPYTDNLTLNTSVLSASGANAIVDWVWIELRDKTDRQVVVDSKSALLQRDGDVVDVDGVSPVSFQKVADDYYVVVAHRNHLGAITDAVVTLSSTPAQLDFSNNSVFVLGGTNAVADMGSGVFALFSGDFDGSGQLLNDDVNAVRPLLGQASSYSNADLDMNAQVLNSDVTGLLLPNLGRGQQYAGRFVEGYQLNLFAKRRIN